VELSKGKGREGKGREGRVLWLFRDFYVVSPSVLIKDIVILAPMVSFELCIDHMSRFYGGR
jgi:hypothetical protein